MLRAVSVLAGFLAVSLGGFCQAADAPKIVAAGEWSKPVTDDRGYAVRGHWSIESLHWVLDVNFREDDSLQGKMLRSLMNPDFLTEVLTLQRV